MEEVYKQEEANKYEGIRSSGQHLIREYRLVERSGVIGI